MLSRLLDLHDTGGEVVVIGGQPRQPRRLDVFRPMLGELGITVVGQPRRPRTGVVIEITTRSGERARVAVLPFSSQRNAISASQAMTQTEAANNRELRRQRKAMIDALTDGLRCGARQPGHDRSHPRRWQPEAAVNASRRPSFEYALPATALPEPPPLRGPRPPPPSPDDRRASTDLHYSGSPLQVDFGEAGANSTWP